MTLHYKILIVSAAILSLSGLCLTGCASGQSSENRMESISAEVFAAEVEQGDVQILDVRTHHEYTLGHLPGAVNIDVKQADFGKQCTEALDKDKTVYVYCRSGKRSKIAAGILADKGFNVKELESGIAGWKGKVVYGVE